MTIRRFDVTEDRVCEYEVYGDMVQDSSGAYVLFEDYHASHAYDEAKERELFEAAFKKPDTADFVNGEYRYMGELDKPDLMLFLGFVNSWFGWLACAKSGARSAE